MENKSCVVALQDELSGGSGWGISVVARGQASLCLRHGVEFVRYHFETVLDLSLIEEHLQGDFKVTCTSHPFRPNRLFERRETLGVNLIVHRAGTSHVSKGQDSRHNRQSICFVYYTTISTVYSQYIDKQASSNT